VTVYRAHHWPHGKIEELKGVVGQTLKFWRVRRGKKTHREQKWENDTTSRRTAVQVALEVARKWRTELEAQMAEVGTLIDQYETELRSS
jgi:hypothetical protein